MTSQNVAATLQYVKLTPNTLPPTRGSSMAEGLDLKSAYNITIPAYGKGLVATDLAILVPSRCLVESHLVQD
jgi:dUTP pyrophosphatase